MGTPLLSILIPTKNRYNTLIPVLKAILEHVDSYDYEIVVQDNSDDNSIFKAFQFASNDSRLKYHYTKKSISIVDNTIFAIENSSGDFLTFIGDDDIVSPYIMHFVHEMQRNSINCLIFNSGYYWWDSVKFTKETFYHRNNALWIPTNISMNFDKLSSEAELDYVLNNGVSGLHRLPRFYHGLIRRTVLDTIKQETGAYLSGSSPDISFAVSIALTLDEYFFVNYPITILGASNNSGGGMSARNRHYGKIEEQPFLPTDIMQKWSKDIPLIWSASTIYPQSVYEVFQTFNCKKKINYLAFYATMLTHESYLNAYTKPVLHNYCKANKYSYFLISKYIVRRLLGKLARSIEILFKMKEYKVEIVNSIETVMLKLKEIQVK